MKVSLNWLRDYVNITLPPRELAQRLTMSGTAVGAIHTIGRAWENIVVGEIIDINPHPSADRLRLATVSLGTESKTVVCGAPNIAVGQRVPFAKPGAELIDGHTGEVIKLGRAKIRGVVSEGMICSEKELGVSERHEGIMILPEDAPVGAPLSEYLGDTILDLEVTPNRPDCLSIIGVAREIAALTGEKVRPPEVSYEEKGEVIESLVSIEIADPELCRRYCASLITDVRIAPSPRWLVERLSACGMRPINNIVDVTNYVMLEYGQPLHAFDYREIRGQRVIVRRAGEGESLVTLDGVGRFLSPDMLVIADKEGPIALAGVMGGLESEVTEATTAILLESANFNNVSIRRTSNSLRLRSEASSRFEKGISPELTVPALQRATKLILELAGGRAARGIIDVYPGRVERVPILLSTTRVKRVLGMEIGINRIAEVLTSLGFACQLKSPSELFVTPPYWRTDIHIPDDLVEEVARIMGYDKVPTTIPRGELPRHEPDPSLSLREKVRDILASCGMQEVITYSLVSLRMLERVATPHPPIRVANPMTSEQEYLRTTLRPGLLQALSSNEKHEEGGIRLFEVGKVFLSREDDLPEEREVVTGLISGPRTPSSWLGEGEGSDFFDAKGIVEMLLSRLGVGASFEVCEDDILCPGRTAGIFVDGGRVGVVGEVHPKILESFDIRRAAFLFELELRKLLPYAMVVRRYTPLPRFPSTVRDIALVVDKGLSSARVQQIIQSFPLVSQVKLFDVYTGEQVPPGKKSLAYRIVYQSPSRTLTVEEVNKIQQEIISCLGRKLGATLRA